MFDMLSLDKQGVSIKHEMFFIALNQNTVFFNTRNIGKICLFVFFNFTLFRVVRGGGILTNINPPFEKF